MTAEDRHVLAGAIPPQRAFRPGVLGRLLV